MRKLLATLTVSIALGTLALPVSAELGSDVPSDATLLMERVQEGGSAGSGIFDIAVPPAGTVATGEAYSARQLRGRQPVSAEIARSPCVLT